MDLDAIPTWAELKDHVHVVIDTPAGSANKYKYDAKLGLFRLGRVMPRGLVFPHDFGSIPGTRAADGDALDVMVLGLPPTFPGCVVTARLVGVVRAQQVEKGRRISNDRLIAMGETQVNISPVRTLRDLQSSELADIERFFKTYNEAHGRDFRITGRSERHAAYVALKRAARAYEKERGDRPPKASTFQAHRAAS